MLLAVLLDYIFFLDADEEAFEDNAEEYMRRDVEGSGNSLSDRVFHIFS